MKRPSQHDWAVPFFFVIFIIMSGPMLLWCIIVWIGFIYILYKGFIQGGGYVDPTEETHYGPKGGRYRYSKDGRTKIYF